MSYLNTVLTWSMNSPTIFEHEDLLSNIKDTKNFGGGLVLPVGGIALKIKGTSRAIYLYHSCCGLVPIHFFVSGQSIYVSQSLFAIKCKAKEHGVPVKDILLAKEGVAYHFSAAGLKKYQVDSLRVGDFTPKDEHTAEVLLSKLVAACTFLKGKRVLTPISGGTDGILTALALQKAGVDQLCVCVGRTEEDFDPKFARMYAEQLGLPYVFLPLPSVDSELDSLLHRAISAIEMSDFSNVLMGMCNVMLADFALANGCEYVVNADLADVVLGNDIYSWGSFNKHNPNPTPKQWAEYRVANLLRTLPTNVQIYKAFNATGVKVVQLFSDREVIEFLLSQDLTATPANGKKPLYYEILNKYLVGGSWVEKGKKVGYYTGAGIGKIRLENPVLSDKHMREVFTSIQGSK